MQVIVSHVNLDFDGLASMLAAKKLYPKAKLVLPTKQGKSVERFLAIYRDSMNLYYPNQIDWQDVSEVILVDIASLQRLGEVNKHISEENVEFIVYDHHQPNDHDVQAKFSTIDHVGATVTLLIEEIQQKEISISAFEATIFALGLYTDTGDFTYLSTTSRDLLAASFLLEKGANLQIVSRFAESPIANEEQQLFNTLLQQSEEFFFDGVDILLAFHQQKEYTGGLALLARKVMETTGSDGVLFVVEMGKRIFIVGRSSSDRVDILPLIKQLGGGGHPKAASAMIKNGSFADVLENVKGQIKGIVMPSVTAKDIMSSPVKVISTITTIEDAQKMMLRYGHTGFPVLENDKLVGIISRRDVDKAKHHGLGHAPVKGYMSTNPLTIDTHMSIEEIQNLMIDKNVGRLPVLENKQLVGIISRTNVIEAIHGEKIKKGSSYGSNLPIEISLIDRMTELLPEEILQLLRKIGKESDERNCRAFMIGGIVRDLVIGRKNEDIDIVIEGDGIAFAKQLTERHGGSTRFHEKFGTATWKHPSGLKIDITSARTEYYDYPAALPTVEMSSLREDLFRRDFTINAMALQLNENEFGKLIDFFHGYSDIQQKKIRILYNLSFVEDPTRILRAVRFEHRFGFKMDRQTEELAQISVDKIASTSKPRLAHELSILLNEEHPVEALRRLHELGVLHYLIGQLTCNEQSLHSVQKFKSSASEILGLLPEKKYQQNQLWICYLAILFARRDNGFETVKGFSLNNETLKVIEEIQVLSELTFEFSNTAGLGEFHKTFKKFQFESILCSAVLKKAPEGVIHLLKKYIVKREQIPTLIDGSMLKQFGIKAGPIYSTILNEIDFAWLNNEISSEDQAIRKVESILGSDPHHFKGTK